MNIIKLIIFIIFLILLLCSYYYLQKNKIVDLPPLPSEILSVLDPIYDSIRKLFVKSN